MSQGFEKETKSSTAKSLLGALLALSSGFLFMFVGLTGMTRARLSVHTSESVRPVQESLDADLLAVERTSFQLSKDGKVLRFRSISSNEPQKIAYVIDTDSGALRRDSESGPRYLGAFPAAQFSSQDGLLVLRWKTPNGDARCSWAIERFPAGRKR